MSGCILCGGAVSAGFCGACGVKQDQIRHAKTVEEADKRIRAYDPCYRPNCDGRLAFRIDGVAWCVRCETAFYPDLGEFEPRVGRVVEGA